MTLAVDASGNGTLVGGKLHAAKAGNVVVTASAQGAVDATLTVTVKPAPVVKTIAGKIVPTAKAGSTVTFANLFSVTGGAVASDFSYAVTPAVTGASVSAAGVLTLAATVAIGSTINVVPTVVTSGAVIGTPNKAVVTTTTAPDLTGFTKDKTAGTVKSDGSDTVVVTLTSVPTNAVLGAVTATVASGKKLKAVVGTGNDANKVTISADTGAAASTDDGDVTIAVAGVTATQTVAITVVAP